MRKSEGCMWTLSIWRRHDWVNRETQWQVLRVYHVSGKLQNGIKIMYVDSLASENGDGEDGSEVSGGRGRVEIS